MALPQLLAVQVPHWGVLMLALAAGLVAGGIVLLLGHYLHYAALLRQEAQSWGELGEIERPDFANLALIDGPDVGTLPEPTAADPFIHGAQMERRQTLRRGGSPVPVYVAAQNVASQPIVAYVLNRSTGGLGLLINQHIEPGTMLSVRTKNAPETVPWIRLEVRNCRRSGGDWELGCAFQRTPPWSVLLLFG